MTLHSIYIFDRKGKTLFTKRYYATPATNGSSNNNQSEEYLSEQRKLIFGMLYSLRDISKMLVVPQDENEADAKQTKKSPQPPPKTTTPPGSLHSVQTAASTLHTLETASGLRFCLYTTPTKSSSNPQVQVALRHIYQQVWIQCVTRSPLYRPTQPAQTIGETNFEQQVDAYLKTQSWFA